MGQCVPHGSRMGGRRRNASSPRPIARGRRSATLPGRMSEFQAGSDPGANEPITGVGQLVDYIRAGARPRSEWRVGTEYEKVGVLRATGAAAPFSGPQGIERVLRNLADRYGWTPKLDRGRVI